MKSILLTVLLALLSTATTSAQKEQDFASRFMALCGDSTSLVCTTISPSMTEQMLSLPSVEENEQVKEVLSQLKSIRMAINEDESETDELFDQAVALARKNVRRYKAQIEEETKKLYVRERNELVIEMVLLMKQENIFYLIDLTGNMTEDFLEQVLQIQ